MRMKMTRNVSPLETGVTRTTVPVHIPIEIERQDRYVVNRHQARAVVVAVPVGFAQVERVLDRNGRSGR